MSGQKSQKASSYNKNLMTEKRLNSAQEKAICHIGGPLLIVAGAGTGKTTVITEKIAHIINTGLGTPEQVLALTFTDKAAEEMEERVDALLNLGYTEMSISTFHAFCQRLLQHHGLDIGLPNQMKLLTETDAWLLMRQHLDRFDLSYYRPLGNPARHIHELLKHFSKCKDELITPEEYLACAEQRAADADAVQADERQRLVEVARAYHTYNQILLENNAFDFADLIYYTVKLFQKRPKLLADAQRKFKFILVDEFQDVNYAQYELVRLLARDDAELTVVGDDDQSIYAFRGASVSNILRFKDDYPRAKEIVLNQNYRSGQDILTSAYTLIQGNNPDRLEVKLKIDKKLISSKPGTGTVRHLHAQTLEGEVRAVIHEIAILKKEHPDATWDDFAILVRANNHAAPYLQALEGAGIPYEFLASNGLYRQPVVLDCINFFKIVTNYHESPSIYRLLRMPFLDFRENDMQKLTLIAKKKSISYYEVLKRAAEFQLSPEGIKIADAIISLIHEGMKKMRSEKPSQILYGFLENSGYLAYLTRQEDQGDRESIRQIYQLKQFFDLLNKYQEAIPGCTVAHYIEQYDYIIEAGDEGKLFQPTDTPDSLNVLTVHASKGLEFRFVFVVNMVEERFPTRTRIEAIEIPAELIKEQLPVGDSHYEEERRLLYVAMTRAKDRLYLAGADEYGGVRKKKLSRFLVELGYGANREETSSASHVFSVVAPVGEESPVSSEAFLYQLPKAFSFSQLQAYESCPYKYKLAHILKIPTKGSASFSFGQTMHSTLQQFYGRIQELNRVTQHSLFDRIEPAPPTGTVLVPDLPDLLKIYDDVWIGDWYESKKQREDYYKKGKEILKLFYASEDGHWTIPVSLEGWFKIKVGSYLVHGRIDRIDQLPDGSLEIIDYKTGKSKQTVVGEEKEQLLIYQIATETLTEYSNIGKPSKLTFFYLNDNIRTSFLGKDPELEKIKEKLIRTMDSIHARSFVPTPNAHVCAYCDFFDICEFRAS